MLIPSTFEKIRKGDYSVSPFTVHKRFIISSENASSLGYTVRQANYYKKILPFSSSKNIMSTAPTSSDGSYNYQNWRSINHLYYRNPYDSIEGYEGFNRNVTDKFLFVTASIISAPYNDMGEGIKRGSVIISGSELYLRDDRKWGLYDTTINTSSYVDSTYLDAYWGFQDLYHKTIRGYGNNINANLPFMSNTREEDLVSTLYGVNVSPGIEVNQTSSGAQIDFTSTSWVMTRPFPEINYEKGDDFTISFWINCPTTQQNLIYTSNALISKNSYLEVLNYDRYKTRLENGAEVSRTFATSSIKLEPTDAYPFDFSVYNQSSGGNAGKILFKRSDGSSVASITSTDTVNDGNYHHVCVTKSGTTLSMYVDGDLQDTATDVKEEPINDYFLLFGTYSKEGAGQYTGSLDEVRFYSTAASATQVSQSLAEKTQGKLYQNKSVGNVFYQRGEVVITSPVRKYHDQFKENNWSFEYKNNYTIYEYETLVRIKAAKWNKTMNPSSTKSHKSNQYLDAFSSGSLMPYVTTIGLYNDKFELVAVGKLGRPLKMRSDVVINTIVRFDW